MVSVTLCYTTNHSTSFINSSHTEDHTYVTPNINLESCLTFLLLIKILLYKGTRQFNTGLAAERFLSTHKNTNKTIVLQTFVSDHSQGGCKERWIFEDPS